jgi:hypothetical protein
MLSGGVNSATRSRQTDETSAMAERRIDKIRAAPGLIPPVNHVF